MTTEEKIITLIREALIEKHGEEFTNLSKNDQNELVAAEILKYIESQKK